MNQIKIKSIMLLVILILSNLSYLLAEGNSNNVTFVGGLISRDTIWTKENSPYVLKDDLTVRPGVSLWIHEGVVVDFSLWSIIIEGELRMLGSPEDEIQLNFTSMPLTSYNDARIVFTEDSKQWKEDTIGGCQLEYVKIYCSENTMHYGLIKGGTIMLDHVTIYGSKPYSTYYTIDINGSIANSLFVEVTRAIRMGAGRIINNRFQKSSGKVMNIFDGIVRDNIIDGGKYGVIIKKGLVQNNTITNILYDSIHLFNSPDSELSELLLPIIVLNLITTSGKNAVYISGNIYPIITQNVFLDNNNGIYFDKDAFYNENKPKIYYNVFYNNTNNIYFDREDPRIEIKLQKNWWGTNDLEIIEDKIYYESDDPRLTAVLYQPILTEIPHFLPRIPYKISLINQSSEVELADDILLSGNISPPLKTFDLTVRYDGPDMRYYEKKINTDPNGVFIDEFSPPVEGIWNISLAFEESERYNYELFQQVLVSKPDNTLSSEPSITPGTNETEDIVSTDLIDADIDSVEVIDLGNESHSESTDVEDADSNDAVPSVDESDAGDSETKDDAVQVVSYTEEETQVSDPLIFGFIPSILIIIVMIAVYIGTVKLKQ